MSSKHYRESKVLNEKLDHLSKEVNDLHRKIDRFNEMIFYNEVTTKNRRSVARYRYLLKLANFQLNQLEKDIKAIEKQLNF